MHWFFGDESQPAVSEVQSNVYSYALTRYLVWAL